MKISFTFQCNGCGNSSTHSFVSDEAAIGQAARYVDLHRDCSTKPKLTTELRYEELGAPMRKPLGVSIATEYPGIALWAGLDGEAFSGHCEQKWERATNGVDLSRYPKYPHIGGVAGFNRGEPVK
jgi:hypothetical protein